MILRRPICVPPSHHRSDGDEWDANEDACADAAAEYPDDVAQLGDVGDGGGEHYGGRLDDGYRDGVVCCAAHDAPGCHGVRDDRLNLWSVWRYHLPYSKDRPAPRMSVGKHF